MLALFCVVDSAAIRFCSKVVHPGHQFSSKLVAMARTLGKQTFITQFRFRFLCFPFTEFAVHEVIILCCTQVSWQPQVKGNFCRGVPRSGDARGKKQVWRPNVRTWGLSGANVLYRRKYLRQCWAFSGPLSESAPGLLCSSYPPRYAPPTSFTLPQKLFDLSRGAVLRWDFYSALLRRRQSRAFGERILEQSICGVDLLLPSSVLTSLTSRWSFVSS